MSNNKQDIHYTIKPTNPAAHIFTVQCEVAKPDPKGQKLWLPAWIPGSYMIRDFAKNIVTLQASDKNGTLAVTKLDKQTWQCAPCTGTLTVTCTVYAWDLSVRTAHLDNSHAFFNGTSTFVVMPESGMYPCLALINCAEFFMGEVPNTDKSIQIRKIFYKH